MGGPEMGGVRGILGAQIWVWIWGFLRVRALGGLSGALPGAVDTDSIPRFRFWAPELLVLTLFHEIWKNILLTS